MFAEWVDGGSLADAIADGRLYNGTGDEVLARILDVAIQFAWGLDCTHSRQLVHQDVKPPNVMCTADWTVKVTDFGLAKARAAAGEVVPSGPEVSVLVGYGGLTPAYCSPEQADARPRRQKRWPARAVESGDRRVVVGHQHLGNVRRRATLFARTDRGRAFRVFREDPWVANPVIPTMPDGIAQLLARCLDPNPVTRLRRFDQLAEQLMQLYQRLIGAPYPRTKPKRHSCWRTR